MSNMEIQRVGLGFRARTRKGTEFAFGNRANVSMVADQRGVKPEDVQRSDALLSGRAVAKVAATATAAGAIGGPVLAAILRATGAGA